MKRYFLLFVILAISLSIFPQNARAVLVLPDIYLSNTNFLQADTLKVTVKNEENLVWGTLGSVKLRFYRSQDGKDWVALVGMPHNKWPGTYRLTVNVGGKQTFRKNITVKKRIFPVTVLAITPQLRERGYSPQSIASNIQNLEGQTLAAVLKMYTPQNYAIKPFINPLSETVIVGNYGDIRKSGTIKLQHLGVDLKAALGVPVLAVNDGKVVFKGSLPDYGNTLVIDHGLGVYSLYLHLSEFKATVDDVISQGQVIGLAGDTGYATGPHLHFSIKMRNASVDPLKFILASQY